MYKEATHTDKIVKKRNNVRAVVYDISNGEYIFLLLKARKGYWQSPQGGIDDGESELEALLRETREETGLDSVTVLQETRHTLEYDAQRKGQPIHVKLAAYAVKADSASEITLYPEEGHTESKWVNYQTALTMLDTYPEQVEAFNKVYEKLAEITKEKKETPDKNK
jgi:8-oxo-dGTP pyrophosphatase MutT (NUDIX family)